MKYPVWIVVPGMVMACGGSDAEDAAPDAEAARVEIVEPLDGDSVPGPDVTVTLAAHGVRIVPAGIDEPDSGHHHLFINRDPTPTGEPMPTEEGIVHLGAAQESHVFEGLAPGAYTVIAVLGDYQHVRLATVQSDTVRFTVSGS